MPIQFTVFKKDVIAQEGVFCKVQAVANRLHDFLNLDGTQKQLEERHVVGASSAGIQEIILNEARELGFQSEKKGLFTNYEVTALRPDYYFRTDGAGILLEVERGKTIANNMDLLDLWKCHICSNATYLFLLVPQFRPSRNGRMTAQFSHVAKRLAPFFEAGNHVNVDAVFLFGY